MGRPPPRSPPPLGRPGGRALAARAGLLVEPRRVDPRAPLRRDEARAREGLRLLPRAALARPVAPRRAPRAGGRAVPGGRPPGAAVGLLRVDRAPVARDLRDQLPRPRVRPPPLRDGRRLATTASRSRSSRSARAGTTTTTSTRPARTRDSSGGRSTSRTTCCASSRRCGWSGISERHPTASDSRTAPPGGRRLAPPRSPTRPERQLPRLTIGSGARRCSPARLGDITVAAHREGPSWNACHST